jgi:UDP-N-acetylmuramate--alanine ligase
LGLELFAVRKHLEEFKGVARRLEILGEFRGAVIIDDYAHHPTEIKASLAAVRQLYPKKFLRLVFHPHTFTRTKALLKDFAASFSAADEVIILDIYGSAREKQGGISSRDLAAEVKKQKRGAGKKQTVRHIPTLSECARYLQENVGRGEVVLLMGAGDVFRVGEKLVKAKQ